MPLERRRGEDCDRENGGQREEDAHPRESEKKV